MPAVSKKQQKFFGIVRSVQKGEQSPTTPEVAKAASSICLLYTSDAADEL